MCAELAEMARDPDLVLKTYFLIAEEDHLIARESVMQLLDLLVAKRLGQVDVADLGADMRARRNGSDSFVGDRLGNGRNFRDLRQMSGTAHVDSPLIGPGRIIRHLLPG